MIERLIYIVLFHHIVICICNNIDSLSHQVHGHSVENQFVYCYGNDTDFDYGDETWSLIDIYEERDMLNTTISSQPKYNRFQVDVKKPNSLCGYRIVYDRNWNLRQEGFVYNDQWVCYGCEIDEITGECKYIGGYVFNGRCGENYIWNQNDLRPDFNELITRSHNDIFLNLINCEATLLHIRRNIYPYRLSISIISYRLEAITIDDNSLQDILHFTLDGLPSLETLTIGKNCASNELFDGFSRTFRLANLRKLHNLDIQAGCFTYYDIFELRNLDRLTEVYLNPDIPNYYTNNPNMISFPRCSRITFDSRNREQIIPYRFTTASKN